MHSFRELADYVLGTPAHPVLKAKRGVDGFGDGESVEEWCKRQAIEVRCDEDGHFHFPVKDRGGLEALPSGYGLKGGAARHLLRLSLGLPIARPPRDIDVVRLADVEPYDGADNELGYHYMRNDYEDGYGVEHIHSLNAYFHERDLTINEVLAVDEEVIATEEAVRDTVDGTIRLAAYTQNNGKKLRAKMLRFAAQSVDHCLHEDWQGPLEIPSFWLAVNLDRAIATEYVRLLREHSQLPQHIQTPEEAATWLQKDLSFFVFRNVREARMLEAAWEDMLYAAQEKLEKK